MIDSVIEMIKLISLMLFVSSVGAQVWIAFLDITNYFTKKIEKYRPSSSQDKFSRIAVIVGVLVLLMD